MAGLARQLGCEPSSRIDARCWRAAGAWRAHRAARLRQHAHVAGRWQLSGDICNILCYASFKAVSADPTKITVLEAACSLQVTGYTPMCSWPPCTRRLVLVAACPQHPNQLLPKSCSFLPISTLPLLLRRWRLLLLHTGQCCWCMHVCLATNLHIYMSASVAQLGGALIWFCDGGLSISGCCFVFDRAAAHGKSDLRV
jgi:hypothetical protein